MVELKSATEDGLDIEFYWKCIIFIGLFAIFSVLQEAYRRKPFVAFYLYILVAICIPLTYYSGCCTILMWMKQILLVIPFTGISLWRISGISEDDFADHFSGFKLNEIVFRVKGKINSNFMEWFITVLVFLNIIWAAYIDFSAASYLNAVCGVLLAFTVALPKSVQRGTPGWFIISEAKTADMMVPDMDWCWVTVYTSWDILFAWRYMLNLWVVAVHLGVPYLFCVRMRGCERYLMVRCCTLYLVAVICGPWRWTTVGIFGEYALQNEMVAIVWGGINSCAALSYASYCVHRVWRRAQNQDEGPILNEEKPEDKEALKHEMNAGQEEEAEEEVAVKSDKDEQSADKVEESEQEK